MGAAAKPGQDQDSPKYIALRSDGKLNRSLSKVAVPPRPRDAPAWTGPFHLHARCSRASLMFTFDLDPPRRHLTMTSCMRCSTAQPGIRLRRITSNSSYETASSPLRSLSFRCPFRVHFRSDIRGISVVQPTVFTPLAELTAWATRPPGFY